MFAVHPLQVEAVAWISGMNNVLAGAFSLACVACYLRFVGAERPRRAWWYVAVLAMFLLALLSKPTAIVTPLLILPIEWFLLRRSWRQIVWSIAPLVVMAIPFVIIGRSSQPATSTFAPPIPQRLIVAGDALGFHLRKLVWPTPLLIDYSRGPRVVLGAGGFSAINWIALTAAVALAAITCRRHRWIAACLAVFTGGVALVLGLVPFSFQEYSTVADRYVYLSMLGVAMFVAIGLSRLRSRWPLALSGVIVAALAVCSFHQAGYWAESATLAQHTLDHNPTSLGAASVLGYLAQSRGDVAAEEHYYRLGLSGSPDDAELNFLLGTLLLKTRPAEALEHFNRMYNRGSHDVRLLNNRGLALMKLGRLNEAVTAFYEALKYDPNHANTHLNLGLTLLSLHQFDEAEQYLKRALELNPKLTAATNALRVCQSARRGGK